MNKRKHYLVYKITNLVNGKTYIGKHETYNIDDGYMGSGELLNLAKKKYGLENFKREILFDFDSREEMNKKEIELVNEQFVRRADTYNATLGGNGGFYHVNSERKNWSQEQWEVFKRNLSTKCGEFNRTARMRGISRENRIRMNFEMPKNPMLGKHHTEATKQKISERMRGDGNPNFGNRWLFDANGTRKQIWNKNTIIPDGLFTKEQLMEYRDGQLPHNRQKSVHSHRRLRWVHNGVEERYVSVSQVDEFLAIGWHRGRLKSNCFVKH